jgi:hypothetical protein
MTNLNRRSFLKGLGILGAAPAIVHAENIMKIWTPPKDIILPSQSIDFTIPAGSPGYYTLSFHIKEGDKDWVQHTKHYYSDGKGKQLINYPYEFKRIPNISITGVQLEKTGVSFERPVIVSNLPVDSYNI